MEAKSKFRNAGKTVMAVKFNAQKNQYHMHFFKTTIFSNILFIFAVENILLFSLLI